MGVSLRPFEIRCGDALEVLRTLSDGIARCCVTSPPYFGLRDYGAEGQIGLEPTIDEYVSRLVEVFREVRRVLTDDGTLWLNLGDSYAGSWGAQGRDGQMAGRSVVSARQIEQHPRLGSRNGALDRAQGMKPKDLMGVPWTVAFALRADGWWLRSEIIWHKPNPMPESVTDRPTKSHEQVFLLSKSVRYFYDAEATREADRGTDHPRSVLHRPEPSGGVMSPHAGIRRAAGRNGHGRNARSVWTITTKPFPEAHFATFPPELPERCIKAGSAEGDLVLDPFSGAGTTGLVALRLGRRYLGIELNPDYVDLSVRRLEGDAPLLNVRQRPERSIARRWA
jgi:DNA modification methylase